MSLLNDMTRVAAETKGLEHKMHIQSLRDYIKSRTTREMLGDIRYIYRQDQLRVLWEAGLNLELQQAVLRRLEELAARRTE